MNSSLEIRKCTLKDLDQLITISRDTFITAFEHDNNPDDFNAYIETAFSKETIHEELLQPESDFYFVYYETVLAGYFKLNRGDAQNEQFDVPSIELERIYILASFQNKGIGSSLIALIIELAKKKDVKFLWLGVWEKNTKAIQFYLRHHFTKIGEHPYYIGKDKQTDWLMKYVLN